MSGRLSSILRSTLNILVIGQLSNSYLIFLLSCLLRIPTRLLLLLFTNFNNWYGDGGMYLGDHWLWSRSVRSVSDELYFFLLLSVRVPYGVNSPTCYCRLITDHAAFWRATELRTRGCFQCCLSQVFILEILLLKQVGGWIWYGIWLLIRTVSRWCIRARSNFNFEVWNIRWVFLRPLFYLYKTGRVE